MSLAKQLDVLLQVIFDISDLDCRNGSCHTEQTIVLTLDIFIFCHCLITICSFNNRANI